MQKKEMSKATLNRVSLYTDYLKKLPSDCKQISATTIAKALKLGEVQVRKDLNSICSSGKPKVGYDVHELLRSLNELSQSDNGGTIIVGAGKLGRALLDYDGFNEYGISVIAAFDNNIISAGISPKGKLIYPISSMKEFCQHNDIKLGIIAVPNEAAQEACDLLYECGIRAVMCFAHCTLNIKDDMIVQYEDLALSLEHLKMKLF